MRIRRYSISFTILLILMSGFFLFAAKQSFEQHITPEKCMESGTPVLFIETDNNKAIKSKEKYVKASYRISWDGGSASGNCRIRGRGNTTWRTRELYKKPYLLRLNKEAPLLGFPEAEKWVLMANTSDKTSLRNTYSAYLCTDVWNRMAWTPRNKFISVFINGRYQGIYGLMEKVEINPGRVDINTADGSFLFEVNSHQNKAWNFRTARDIPFSIRQPEESSSETFTMQQDFIQHIEDVIYSEQFTDKDNGWRKYLDEDSFIDWYLVNEFTKNHDAAFQSSCFMYYNAGDKKVYMGPAWDFDIALGNISYDDCDKPEGFWISLKGWYKRLFEDPQFAKAVQERWNEQKDELINSVQFIDRTAEDIEQAVMLNDSVWKNIGHRQWPHAPGWKSRKTYDDELQYMKDWIEKRIIWMDNEFNQTEDTTQKYHS